MFTDSLKLWQLNAEILIVVPREGDRLVSLSLLGVPTASITACCKTNVEHNFQCLPFLTKRKIPFGFLWLAKTGTNAGLL